MKKKIKKICKECKTIFYVLPCKKETIFCSRACYIAYKLKNKQLYTKRIKIIPIPKSDKNIKSFIEFIVSPVTFKDLEIGEDEIVLNAGSQSKAALIGRDKRRLLEMQQIVKNFFKKDFRII